MEETQLLKVTTECPGGQWFGKAQPSCKKQPEQKTCAHTCQGHGMGAVGSCVLPRDDPNPAVLWERGMSTQGMLGTQVARPAGDGKSPSYFQSG